MGKMIEITAAEYERLQDCIREDGMRIAALIEENKALHQDAKHLTAVEAAPVVHGRWVEYPVAHYFKCSKCKYIVPYKKAVRINEKQAYNYCPSCGAKMDGEKNAK